MATNARVHFYLQLTQLREAEDVRKIFFNQLGNQCLILSVISVVVKDKVRFVKASARAMTNLRA